MIGWANVRRYSLRYGYRLTYETGIYLDQTAIGRGVGDVLQSRIEEHCRECGIHHAVAKIVADNQRSMAFHYRRGYELVGIQKEVGHMDGKWVDVAILQMIFRETERSHSSKVSGALQRDAARASSNMLTVSGITSEEGSA